jgi:Tripartite tricarboxylate transporter TctB family
MVVRRFHAEVVAAGVTAALGLAAVVAAMGLGYGWEEHGPQSGYFPFYVGLILIAASLWNLARAFVRHRDAIAHAETTGEIEEPFLDRDRLVRLARFLGALVAFVVVTVILGFYVGATLYIAWSAWRGGYRLLVALGLGLAFAISLYLVFEVAFRVPLLKGPLEPLLGIY